MLEDKQYQIQNVHKSNTTGRVVSVSILAPTSANYDKNGNAFSDENSRPVVLTKITVERMGTEVYTPPTPDDLRALKATQSERREKAPKKPSLINPTREDAERLQSALNAAALARREVSNTKYYKDFEPAQVLELTQAQYTAHSKGSYARFETRGLCRGAELEPRTTNLWRPGDKEAAERRGPAVCKVRTAPSNGWDAPRRIVIISDKPRKAFPVDIWQVHETTTEAPRAQTEMVSS